MGERGWAGGKCEVEHIGKGEAVKTRREVGSVTTADEREGSVPLKAFIWFWLSVMVLAYTSPPSFSPFSY